MTACPGAVALNCKILAPADNTSVSSGPGRVRGYAFAGDGRAGERELRGVAEVGQRQRTVRIVVDEPDGPTARRAAATASAPAPASPVR